MSGYLATSVAVYDRTASESSGSAAAATASACRRAAARAELPWTELTKIMATKIAAITAKQGTGAPSPQGLYGRLAHTHRPLWLFVCRRLCV